MRLVAHSRGQYPGTRLPKGSLSGLRSIGCWDAIGPQSWGLPVHRNEGIEICYLLSGETPFATDTETHLLRAGDITITRPWQRHCLGDPRIRPCKLFWMILDVEIRRGRSTWQFPDWIAPDFKSRHQLLRVFRKNPRSHLIDPGKELLPFLERISQRLGPQEPLTVAHLSNAINTILLAVAEHLQSDPCDRQSDPDGFDQTIRQFYQGLEKSTNKAAEPWSVETIAHVCRVGKSYLTRSCREIFNAAPAELLNRIRLNHARDLLEKNPDIQITEIAHAVGFSSSQYFASCFRKQFGRTPTTHRKKQINPHQRPL